MNRFLFCLRECIFECIRLNVERRKEDMRGRGRGGLEIGRVRR